MSLADCVKRHMKSQPTMPPPLEAAKKKKNLEKYQPSTLQSIPLSPTIRLPVLYELIKLF